MAFVSSFAVTNVVETRATCCRGGWSLRGEFARGRTAARMAVDADEVAVPEADEVLHEVEGTVEGEGVEEGPSNGLESVDEEVGAATEMAAAVAESRTVEITTEAALPKSILNRLTVQEAGEKYKLHENDSGSPEFQIARLTARIKYMTEHAVANKKDNGSKRGLLAMVASRKKLLKYLRSESQDRYRAIVSDLGIRVAQADA